MLILHWLFVFVVYVIISKSLRYWGLFILLHTKAMFLKAFDVV